MNRKCCLHGAWLLVSHAMLLSHHHHACMHASSWFVNYPFIALIASWMVVQGIQGGMVWCGVSGRVLVWLMTVICHVNIMIRLQI